MSNREIFIDKLRQLSKEEMLERYIALLNTEKLTDYVSDLEAKLAESERERHEEWKTGKEWKWECDRLKKQLAKKENEKSPIPKFKNVSALARYLVGIL